MRVVRQDQTSVAGDDLAHGVRTDENGSSPVGWHLAEEAAIAFLINGQSFAVMMATPRDLEDFALGFLITERIISAPAELEEVRLFDVADGYIVNCLVPGQSGEAMDKRRRTLTGRSGCGICGAETLEVALPKLPAVTGRMPEPRAARAALRALPGLQPLNRHNHSTHAAAFFSFDGNVSLAREDVGRHNALDKLGGAMLRAGIDGRSGFAVLSSRMSVEIVQKAAILGLPCLGSVSAPTDLALRAARRAGLKVFAQSGDGVMVFADEASS